VFFKHTQLHLTTVLLWVEHCAYWRPQLVVGEQQVISEQPTTLFFG